MSVAPGDVASLVACESSYSLTITTFVLARAAHRGCWRRTCALCFRLRLVDNADDATCELGGGSPSGGCPASPDSADAEVGFPASGSPACDAEAALTRSLRMYHSLMYRTTPCMRMCRPSTVKYGCGFRAAEAAAPKGTSSSGSSGSGEMRHDGGRNSRKRDQYPRVFLKTWVPIMMAKHADTVLDWPPLDVEPPPSVAAMTGLARSRMAFWTDGHRNRKTSKARTSTQSTVTSDGIVECQSSNSARWTLTTEWAVSGDAKVRTVKTV
ncbi:hypothetical protein VUR80DRAFT_7002 [Thermomyces stellatus]